MIDIDGFRLNVGIILANDRGQVLWARRIGQNTWQFPQGGINEHESVNDAMYRELHEEIGIYPNDVEILGCTMEWLRYFLPKRHIRWDQKPRCIGQKQKWFLLKLLSEENCIQVDRSPSPEFDSWRWVSYWYPLGQVIAFKREVYRQALKELIVPAIEKLQFTD